MAQTRALISRVLSFVAKEQRQYRGNKRKIFPGDAKLWQYELNLLEDHPADILGAVIV